MLDNVSPAVERALAAARHQAGDGEMDAVHLFLALIEDDEGRAAQTLIEAGGELTAIRAAFDKHPPVELHMPDVLTGAREVAGERDETTITGEYLLVGLIRALTQLQTPLQRAGVVVERLAGVNELPPIEFGETIEIHSPPDVIATGRVLDVNANRAREALRVLDDYCRFVINDAVLTEELKSARHELVRALARLPHNLLHEARDTLNDVGTTISTSSEMHRSSTAEVARINCQRLQEALRSLEEYGKVLAPDLAAIVEAIRYRTYTLERALATGADARLRLERARLYVLLTGSQCLAALDWTIAEAEAGGASIFQLREKDMTDRALLERARNVRRWTRAVNALFILNDRPDIARLAEADGVHLGQDDMGVSEARRVLGPGPFVGVSTHNAEQVKRAVLDGASYIGVGPTFTSSTKEFGQFAGLDFVGEANRLTSLPAFVIGGVNVGNIGQVVAAGGKRVAVSAAICRAEDPRLAAAQLAASLRT